MVVASLAGIAPFLLIVEASRRMLAGTDDGVIPLVLTAIAVLGLRGLLQAGALFWSHLIDARHQMSLRVALVDKLARLPLGWFTARSSGEIKKHLQDDVAALHYLVAHAQLEIVAAITGPVVTLAYLFWVDWRLALVLLAPFVLYALALRTMMGSGYADKLAEYEGWQKRVDASVIEFVDGIAVVRAFGQPRKAHRRFQEAVDGYAAFFRAWSTPMLRLESAASVLLSPPFVMLLVLVVGLLLLQGGAIEPLTLLPFLLLGLGLGSAVLNLGYGAQALRQASTAAGRLHELDLTAELPVAASPASPPSAPAGVEFDGVGFAYDDTREVLSDVTLTLDPGTITALVGPSGSGKSTLARLLPRFADPQRGRVRIGDVDLRDLDPRELYRLVGFVLQDVALLRGTVRDNIAIGRPEATDADIERVARAAQIHDRILELPRGYASEVGVDARLSGGEAQRVAIARALLSDTPIVVLDEATAFADPESEAAIQDALATLIAGRTVLVIAHRLHTITGVDRIVVLEGGRVVQQGVHAELVATDGLYRRLWAANERARDHLDPAESVPQPTEGVLR
jgi:ATP-binding cassette subfamily B protein/ATP-binding cassette subfamily B protein IrtA